MSNIGEILKGRGMKSQNKVKSLLLVLAVLFAMGIANPASADQVTLAPNAPGDLTQLGPNPVYDPPVPNWQYVLTNDGDSSYVGTASINWQSDLYNLDDPAVSGTINWIRIYVAARSRYVYNPVRTSLKTLIKVGGTVYEGVPLSLTTSYLPYYTEYPANPGGGSWTWADIDALQGGASFIRTEAGGWSRATQVWVVVDYTVSGSISGTKFYDADTDGVWDEGEPAIEGFKIELYDDKETLLDTQFTDENGEYLFDELDAGTYTVKEIMPPGEIIFNEITYPKWLNTTDDSITIEDLSGASEDNNFGNVCIGCDVGTESKGWWTNNGADVGTDDLPVLCLLNLRDTDGEHFDPTFYGIKETGKFPEGTFAYWLQEAGAVNMAYMLSAQLATMKLNVLNGMVDDEALVYAPGTDSANATGFASIGELMSEANAELGIHGTAMSGDGWRDYQEALKNALDAANNNVNFVCPEPCLPIEYPIL